MRKWPALLSVVLLLGGCRDERVIEKVGFVRTLAFDTAENNSLKVSVSIPKSNQKDAIVYAAVAKSAHQAFIIFDRQNDRRLVNGQLRQVLFSMNTARLNMWEQFDSMLRDPSIGNRTHMLIVDGDPEEMLRTRYLQANSAGEYIEDLIRAETKSMDIPVTNLHTFARDYYDDGIDPVMSILKQTSNSIIVDGIALFREGRYVGKIEADNKMYFGMLHGSLESGDMAIVFPNEGYSSKIASLLYLKTRRKISVLRTSTAADDQDIQVRIRISLIGSLLEYQGGLHLEKPSEQRKLESDIARYVQEKCEETIGRMQELKADGIGVGQSVRNAMAYRDWRKLNWAEAFSKAKIDVSVSVGIRNYGEFQ